jgi:hypothetical protein
MGAQVVAYQKRLLDTCSLLDDLTKSLSNQTSLKNLLCSFLCWKLYKDEVVCDVVEMDACYNAMYY